MFEVKMKHPIYEISHKFVEAPTTDRYTQHIHTFCEMLLFVSGDASFNIDGTVYRPRPYDLLLIPEGTYHYLIPNPDMPYENYVLDFHREIMAPSHHKRLFSRHLIVNIAEDREFCRYFRRLDAYHETYSPEDFATCTDALLRELCVFCSYRLQHSAPVQAIGNPLVEAMVRLIAQNIERPLDADFLAHELMLSKSYLQNTFSSAMHIGLQQYIIQKKIYAAQNDLNAGMTPGDVCIKYSFGDYSSFFRLYKKLLGVSPREAKREGRVVGQVLN